MPKNTPKKTSKKIERDEKKAQAIALKKAGVTYEDIATQLGCAVSTAHKMVNECLIELAEKRQIDTDAWRQLQIARYEKLLQGLWSSATRGFVEAVREARQVLARLDRVTGIEAPIKHQQEITGKDGAPLSIIEYRRAVAERIDYLDQMGEGA